MGRTRDDAASDLNLLRAQVSGIAAVLHDGAWIGGESPTFALTLSGLVDEAASTARVVEAQLTGVYDDEPTD
ncbi:MAG: hypothetical protein LBV00_04030, partial [Propionibacteriaceae bacterium]|nr:hypothetical protein [Propionibacteriaceae bacterium]